jgi:hypothetical protein
MRLWSEFGTFKTTFVIHAKLAGIPEYYWKNEIYSRMSDGLKEALEDRVENDVKASKTSAVTPSTSIKACALSISNLMG